MRYFKLFHDSFGEFLGVQVKPNLLISLSHIDPDITSVDQLLSASNLSNKTIDEIATNILDKSKNLLEDVRKGNSAFLKVNSYRFHGHARMDKSPYRDQQEEEEGRKKDAIAFLRDRIVKSGWYQETECDAIVEEVKQEMDEALNHARNAADPGADEMYEDIFDPQTTKPFPFDSRIRESLHLPQA